MDTLFEFIYYIAIIATLSMFNTQKTAFGANSHEPQAVVQQYQPQDNIFLKKASQHARRLSECD